MKTIQFLITISAAISVICHLAIQVIGSLRLQTVRDKIGGTIKSRADLDQVKAAIQLNLFLGIPVVCNAIIMLVLLMFLCVTNKLMWLSCIAVLAVGQTVVWLVFRALYKQFKALPVVNNDDDLLDEYRSYVTQWSGFKLFLKPPKTKA